MVLPVEIHPIFYMTDAERDRVLEDAMNDRQSRLVRHVIMAESHDLWMKTAVISHLFSLVPNWNDVVIGQFLGVGKGPVCKWRSHKDFPTLDKIRFWLDAFESTLPQIGDRIFLAHGLVSAMHRVTFELESGEITDPRRRMGIPVDESTLEDTAILHALVTPPIFETWKELAMANCEDLEQAFDTTAFTNCLAVLIHCASSLLGSRINDAQLDNAQQALAAIDLESPGTVHDFSARIVSLWNLSTQFEMEKLKNGIGSYFNM